MIKVENLTRTFGPKVAVNNVSFTVERGENPRVSGAQRRRQIDHHADDHRLLPAQRGPDLRRWASTWWSDPIEAKRLIGYLPRKRAVVHRHDGVAVPPFHRRTARTSAERPGGRRSSR
jgi:hypothetical protein